MIVVCAKKALLDAILDPRDRATVDKMFRGSYVPVRVGVEKTRSQLGAIWRDFTIVAEYLYTTKEAVYAMVRTAPQLYDIWAVKETIGATGQTIERIRSLGELSKDEVSELIPRMRDYLQGVIDEAYGEPQLIDWSIAEGREVHEVDD